MMSFKSWLLKQKDEHSPVGDLARDLSVMRASVPNSMTFEDLKEILDHADACDNAQEALRTAWARYQEYVSQQK